MANGGWVVSSNSCFRFCFQQFGSWESIQRELVEERVKEPPIVKHVAGVQVQCLPVQITGPQVRWWQLSVMMTLSQMPSPLTDGTPGTNVPTHKGCMCGSIFASGIFANWIFDAALVLRLGFDEDSARSAVLRQVVEKRLKRL